MTNDKNSGKPGIDTDAASTAPQWAEERVRLQLLIGEFLNGLMVHNETIGATAAEIASQLGKGISADQSLTIAQSMMRIVDVARSLNGQAQALVTCTEKLLGTFPTTGFSH